MKKALFSIYAVSVICIFLLTTGSALSAEFKKIDNKTINWKTFIIRAPNDWLGSNDQSQYTLIYNSGKEYGAIILSDMDSMLNESQYNKFLANTYKNIAKNPDNSDVTLNKRTPYNILGMKNTPAVVSISKGKRFFTFAPYINHRVYTVIVVSWHKNSKKLPGYLADMLNNISVKTKSPKQIVNKLDKFAMEQEQTFSKKGDKKKINTANSRVSENKTKRPSTSSSSVPVSLSKRTVLQLHPAKVGDAEGALKKIKSWWNTYGVKMPYRMVKVDLNGDNIKEIIVHINDYHCNKKGNSVCPMTVLTLKGDKKKFWDSMTPSYLKAQQVSLLPTATNGYHDLAFDDNLYSYDGKEYRKREKSGY